MLSRLKKRSGNKFTIMSIVMIILMLYVFKLTMGSSNVEYPNQLNFENAKYQYSQTIRESSYKFARKYNMNYGSNALLIRRGENSGDMPERVYIFTSWRTYREYILLP